MIQRLIAILMILLMVIVPLQAQEATETPTESTTEASPPAEQVAEALTVDIGVYVVGISEFNLDSAIYNADFYLTMHCSRPCTDEEIEFDVIGVSGSEGLNIEARLREETYAEYRVQAVLAQNNIDLRRFPFDAHQLKIIVESKFKTTDEVNYTIHASENGIDEDVILPGWFLDRTHEIQITEKTYYGAELGYPRYTFVMSMNRAPLAAFLRSILPALVILLISFLSSFVPDRIQRLGVAGGILLAMLLHHLAVAAEIPAVAYPVYFDAFMLVNDAAIMFQFAATVYEIMRERNGTSVEVLDRITYMALGASVILWIVLQVVVYFAFGLTLG